MIPSLLGLGPDAAEQFDQNVSELMRLMSFNNDAAGQLDAIEDLYDKNDALLATSIASATGDSSVLLGRLGARCDAGDFAIEDLCVLASDLMMAGTEQIRNQLSLALLLLAAHPVEWDKSRTGDVAPMAVANEILRRLPSMAGVPRLVVSEFEIGGLTFVPGEFIGVSTLAANVDGSAFSSPAQFMVNRHGRPNLAFGAGAHHCVGSALARATLQMFIEVLSEAILKMEVQDLEWRPGVAQRGLEAMNLVITWNSKART